MERRAFLKLGCLGLASLGWRPAGETPPKRKLILVWLGGGHSNIETFDAKPNAPHDVQGPFQPIGTSIPGVHFSELLPKLAAVAHKMTVFRTITCRNGDHYNSSFEILRDDKRVPTLAERVGKGAAIPYAICEVQPPYSYIEKAHSGDWLKIEYSDGQYKPPSVTMEEPIGGRLSLLNDLERHIPGTDQHSQHRQAAVELLMGGGRLASCFKLPERDLERFGNTPLSSCVLLAKRLTEAGAGAVTVVAEHSGGWDAHYRIGEKYPEVAGAIDAPLAALVNELNDDTVCLVCSEFGRTPRLNNGAGRDHWNKANTALMFGGGVSNGIVVGRTDNLLMPKDRPIAAPMLCNTALAACGDTSIAGNLMASEALL